MSQVAILPIKSVIVAVLLCLASVLPTIAQEGPTIPQYWDERERLPAPDISALERVRFLTTNDFPPFNYLDEAGRPAGFHVELVRLICAELDISDICQIQVIPWDELEEALGARRGEAVIAGLAVTAETRDRLAFTRSYLRFPARFIVQRGSPLTEPLHQSVADRRVGVLEGSAHEAMLRDYFGAARPVTYSRQSWMMRDLREGRIDAVFGDGMRLSFWLADAAAENCCRFAGGPYLSAEFLGLGLAIATRREDEPLARAFDYALREISVSGRFAELYLRHFPIGFY
ncbi:transporter substrate-binding domain-containing protein [Chelativorans sp. ZYF759]|uniref:transporter substrate-binding domain-containing protein n=1 Tax=Chelativorans sp. ZYF759 TaxID=2692213 RepID=UPI0034D774EE